MAHLIDRTSDAKDLEVIQRLRVDWLVPEAKDGLFPSGRWLDAHDEHALHWIVRDEDRVVAFARLCIHAQISDVPNAEAFSLADPVESPLGCISRTAIDPAYRGRGISSELDRVRIDAARQASCRSVLAFTHAGSARVAALQRRGFRILGEPGARAVPIFGAGTALALALWRAG